MWLVAYSFRNMLNRPRRDWVVLGTILVAFLALSTAKVESDPPTAKGRLLWRRSGKIIDAAVSADGRLLAVCSADTGDEDNGWQLTIWNWEKDQILANLNTCG
jgi:hypothetical protein